jgi:hypothetical protein
MFDRYNVYKIIIYIIYASKSQLNFIHVYMLSFFDIPENGRSVLPSLINVCDVMTVTMRVRRAASYISHHHVPNNDVELGDVGGGSSRNVV